MSITFGAIYAHSSPTKKKFCMSIVNVSPYELCVASKHQYTEVRARKLLSELFLSGIASSACKTASQLSFYCSCLDFLVNVIKQSHLVRLPQRTASHDVVHGVQDVANSLSIEAHWAQPSYALACYNLHISTEGACIVNPKSQLSLIGMLNHCSLAARRLLPNNVTV
jgi:hypothetical protein